MLLDLWPLGRRGIFRLVAEKVPLMALAAGAAWLALLAQHSSGALSGLDMLPLGQRLANAVVAYVAYVVDLVWPFRLAVFYPMPMEGWPAWRVATSSALLLVVSALALAQLARRRWIAAGWLWYLVTLIPVIGLVHVGILERRGSLAESDPESAAAALVELGNVQANHLKDAEAALDALERGFAIHPQAPGIATALETLYRKTESWGPHRRLFPLMSTA